MFGLLEDFVDTTADVVKDVVEIGADAIKTPLEFFDDLFDVT